MSQQTHGWAGDSRGAGWEGEGKGEREREEREENGGRDLHVGLEKIEIWN